MLWFSLIDAFVDSRFHNSCSQKSSICSSIVSVSVVEIEASDLSANKCVKSTIVMVASPVGCMTSDIVVAHQGQLAVIIGDTAVAICATLEAGAHAPVTPSNPGNQKGQLLTT